MMINLFTRPAHRVSVGPFVNLSQEGDRLIVREPDGSHPRLVAERLASGSWRISAWVHLPAEAFEIGHTWEQLVIVP
jgi:hypothetical protein